MSKSVILGQNIHMHKFVNIWATMLLSTLSAGICLHLQSQKEKNELDYFLNLKIMTSNN